MRLREKLAFELIGRTTNG